jgi:hypothetical protein
MDKKFDQFDSGSSSEADSSKMIEPQRSAQQPSRGPEIANEPPLFQAITERYISEVTLRSKDMEDRWNATKDKLHKADFTNHDLRSKLIIAKRSSRFSKLVIFVSFAVNAILCALIFLLIRNGTLSVDLVKKTIEGLG